MNELHRQICITDVDVCGVDIHVCLPSQFKCSHPSRCIPGIFRCNGQNNCGQGEDEKDCRECLFLHHDWPVISYTVQSSHTDHVLLHHDE